MKESHFNRYKYTIYRSRTNSVDHLTTAIENGFAYAVVNAPVIIADGLYSRNYENVKIDKNILKV